MVSLKGHLSVFGGVFRDQAEGRIAVDEESVSLGLVQIPDFHSLIVKIQKIGNPHLNLNNPGNLPSFLELLVVRICRNVFN